MRSSLRQVLFRSTAGLDLNFAGGVFSLNNTRTASPAAIPGWSFSRTDTNGTATALDLAGNVIQFATGTPRITNRGILVEEARTNLFLNSAFAGGGAAPTNWTQPAATGTSTPVTSTITTAATAYQQSGTAQRPYFTQQVTLAVGTYIVSAYVESVTGSVPSDQFMSFGGGTATATIGYPACPANPASGINNIVPGLMVTALTVTVAGTLSPRIGLGTSAGGATGTVRFSLPQVELGAFSTSPIITTGAAGTRGADTAIVTPVAFSQPFTVAADWDLPLAASVGVQNIANWTNATGFSRRMRAGLSTTAFQLNDDANVLDVNLTAAGPTAAGVGRGALRAQTNNAAATLNGTSLGSDTSCDIATMTILRVGSNASVEPLNGYIRRVRVLPFAATDAQLQALTAP